MARKNSVPNYSELITVTYAALKALGGSGKNDEINNKAAEILGLSDDVLEVPHLNSSSLSEINYRLAWARTLLKRSGAIANSARAVWAISPSFSDVAEVDGAAINKAYHKKYITERASDISKRMNTEMVDDSSEIALEIDSVFEKWEQLAENFDEEHFYYGEKFLIKEPDDGEGRLMKPFNTSRNDPAFDTMTSMRNVDSTVAGNVLIWEEV